MYQLFANYFFFIIDTFTDDSPWQMMKVARKAKKKHSLEKSQFHHLNKNINSHAFNSFHFYCQYFPFL